MVSRLWKAVGAQLDGGGTDGAVGRRCRREEGKTGGIYKGDASLVTSQ
jgi:hypothetical protein